MATIIAVANQKGGVGKTTTCMALGAALRECGRRVLMVDLDPQASLTLSCGARPEPVSHTVYRAIKEAADGRADRVGGFVLPTAEGMDLLPSAIDLSQAEYELIGEPLGIFALRDALEPLNPSYDVVLIDCPPSLGILTANALAAAHQVVIPVQADYLALTAVNLLLAHVAKIQRRANRGLRVAGVILTMVDGRTLHSKEMAAVLRRDLGAHLRVFEPEVHASVRFKEAPLAGQSILTYASGHPGARAYREIACILAGGAEE